VLVDLTIKQFLERVASGEPVPGGGSVAALAAALSASLSEMVARLTLGRKSDPALDEKMSGLIDEASRLRTRLVSDVDGDSDAYAAVMKAYRMPKGTDEEKDVRKAAVRHALKNAARVPLSVAEAGIALLKLAGTAVAEGNSSAVTDGLVAALTARSAVIGALYNVRINLASIDDSAFREDMARRVDTLEKEAVKMEKDLLSLAESVIKKHI
jgi:formiminotetrahydrofolate cyclodeaminase